MPPDRWCPDCRKFREPAHEHPPSLFDLVEEIDEAPGRTRRDDHPTSKAGAASVAIRAGSQKARLLVAYRTAGVAGLTDDEAADHAGISPTSCYWKRCNELRQAGAITATGATRLGSSGVERMVCRVTGAWS